MKKKIVLITLLVLVLILGINSNVLGTSWKNFSEDIFKIFPKKNESLISPLESTEKVRVVDEESVVTSIVEKMTPSVVTVGMEQTMQQPQFDPFDPFGFFGDQSQPSQPQQPEDANIGSGFIVGKDGLIVTNKHVVSQTGVNYKVITSDNKTYPVKNIYRDPANDIAVLKIDPPDGGLKTVELGDSSKIKVGQLVVAMGTPLGEFRGTVTKGIISGLGRGITAGSPFEGYVEKLDGVIQTDAAINPGNSGGPLIGSAGQVIGINTAVASNAQNIGFALPINLVKQALDNFTKTGSFNRAYLGVSYQMVTREISIMNNIPEGAFVREVIKDSAADKGGIQKGDIITYFDSIRIQGDSADNLSKSITKKKIGDNVKVKIWRDKQEKELTVTMGEYRG